MSLKEKPPTKRVLVVYNEMAEVLDAIDALKKQYTDVTFLVCSRADFKKGGVSCDGLDLILTLGGDGTLLGVVGSAVCSDTPIVGANFGRVGYLCNLSSSELTQRFGDYIYGKTYLDERALLSVELGGKTFFALNEFTFMRGDELKVSDIDVSIDDSPLVTYRADGVLVASATGSSAYAYSLGSPLFEPRTEVCLVKPISSRPKYSAGFVLVNRKVTLSVRGNKRNKQNHLVYSDGVKLGCFDRIEVKVADKKLKLPSTSPATKNWVNKLGDIY